MSTPGPPYPPPPNRMGRTPPYPVPTYPVPPQRPTNGAAVTAMVLGCVAAGLAILPYINLVGMVAALIGLVLGPLGFLTSRRTGTGAVLAIAGTTLSLLAIGVSALVTFTTHRYLADLFDTVDPPEATASVGETFETDDGALTVTVDEVICPDDAGYRSCTFTFRARNNEDTTQHLDHVRVKAVVDGAWQDPVLDGTTTIAPGATETIHGEIGVTGALDGLAFDADDASSHSAVVVDVSQER